MSRFSLLGIALAVYIGALHSLPPRRRSSAAVRASPRARATSPRRAPTTSCCSSVSFSTLTAAGIQFDRLTVLAGALGVGTRFRPSKPGPELRGGPHPDVRRLRSRCATRSKSAISMGEVSTIGFRASTVRTLQGAEVIVPNATLIADQVINWTLSDQKRRIEIDIGVQYGSDPVTTSSRSCAKSGDAHPKVLKEPPADALFIRHGESSLDFQLLAWVGFDDYARRAERAPHRRQQTSHRRKDRHPLPAARLEPPSRSTPRPRTCSAAHRASRRRRTEPACSQRQ